MKKTAAFLYRYPFFLFLLFLIFAYLPVFLPFFHLKNDLITQILPTRFVISESIHSGFTPWWNPYINYGIPQYGDMNCGFWNPLLWVIAFIFRYNIWTITYEEIFYILLCGWGMYLLLKELNISKPISILAGFTYMCSGYIIGHMQHFCWITGAAFLPFVSLYFIRINKRPLLKNFLAGSFFSFLFLSSTHPGIVIGAAYFFALCIIGFFLFKQSILKTYLSKYIIRNNIYFIILSVIFSTCTIVSYTEVLSFVERGTKLPNVASLGNGTSLQSYISLVFPLAVHKSAIFNTDISMRNIYIGLFSLPGIFYFIKSNKRKIVVYTLSCLFFFILISSGGLFKSLANNILPLVGYVRSSGEFSIFSVFIMIILSAIGFNSVLQKNLSVNWANISRIATIFFLFTSLLSIALILFTKNSVLLTKWNLMLIDSKSDIKFLLDSTSIWDLILIQSIINMLSSYWVFKTYTRWGYNSITTNLILNLIIITWLVLPFTGVGSMSKKEVWKILTPVSKGLTIQPLIPLNLSDTISQNYERFTGLPYAYLKKIGTREWNPYPITLNNSAAYFQDSTLKKFIEYQPFLFLSSDTTVNAETSKYVEPVNIQIMGPGILKAVVKNRKFDYITFLQNDYPYWTVSVNGKEVSHFTGYKTFITTPVPKETFSIVYKFEPQKITRLLWINGMLIFIAAILFLFLELRFRSQNKNFKKT